jgi:hypothetical protein
METIDSPSNIDSEFLPMIDEGDQNILRRKSINEIDVSDIIIGDMEKPFENERAKYELQRFLQSKNI